ncbi:uncharacterized protein CDAR_9341 [Caerostris darwini]|uniref:Uncharacterized protein n=1 Tax=Caerostris darwini TaxID=1538125 RepID=A0AAV4NY81_9ARAC|nr:uncharacterized protein CDAR_9341 [Caerostris darwini]
MKQGFYLPSDTWFKQEKEPASLSPEYQKYLQIIGGFAENAVKELDILNSTSTKAFVKFLEERKKSPPKVLKEIQKKLETMQVYEK